ncbi:MAG: hypothetical protein AAF492_28945, partial [Verrucomicrobiota bacterium]
CYMKKSLMMGLVALIGLTVGCSTGWKLDYGEPAAQFVEADVGAQAKPYIGKKITVKGTVTKTVTDDPDVAWIHLENGIRCSFSLKAMVASKKVGDDIYIDGILRRCDKDDILLDPAILRDSKAPFSPN